MDGAIENIKIEKKIYIYSHLLFGLSSFMYIFIRILNNESLLWSILIEYLN